MSLQAGMQNNVSSRCLRGDVALLSHCGVAEHALVIMLGRVTTHYKQTVINHFTGKSKNEASLKPIIVQVIKQAHIRLHVITAVASDTGKCPSCSMAKLWCHLFEVQPDDEQSPTPL